MPNKKHRLSVKTIIANVVRDMGLDDVSFHYDSMIEWAAEAEVFIGSYETYERIECEVDVENYRAELPCGFYKLISLKIGDKYPEMTNRDFRLFYNASNNLSQIQDGGEFKFSLDNHYIHFSNYKSGKAGMAYLAVPTDEDGFPYILNTHEPAVVAYIMWKMKTIDYIRGEVPLYVYQTLERRWLRLCAQTRGNDTMPDNKELEYASAVWKQLVPPPTQLDVFSNMPTFQNRY